MLKNAFIFCNGNVNIINNEFIASLNTDKDYYKYLFYSDNESYKLVHVLYEDNGSEIQYVSVGEYGELLGYFSGTISNGTKKYMEYLYVNLYQIIQLKIKLYLKLIYIISLICF